MKRSYTTHDDSVTVIESTEPGKVIIGVLDANRQYTYIGITKEDFYVICDLRYTINFVEPPVKEGE